MCLSQKKYRKPARPLILMAFLLIDLTLFSQQKGIIDSVKTILPDKPSRITGFGSISFSDLLLNLHQTLIPSSISNDRELRNYLIL